MLADSTVQLSCLAGSVNEKYIAVGEGSATTTHSVYGSDHITKEAMASVFVYNVETKKLHKRLTFHPKGVQSMCFSYDGKYLITLGAQGDDTLAVWDVSSGSVISSAPVTNQATNQVKVDPPLPGL